MTDQERHQQNPENQKQHHKKRRWLAYLTGFLILLLILIHLFLPVIVKHFLNEKLADMGDYRGHIDDVDIALYRGAYQLDDLDIVKVTENEQPVPFFRTDRIDISISWKALWRGYVLADVRFESPELNFVDSASDEGDQAGQGTDWRDALTSLVPITINRVDIGDGVIAFRNFESEPPVNIQITELEASASNLTNVDGVNGTRVASLTATGLMLNHADISVKAQFDPFKQQDFVIAAKINEFSLPMLNPLAKVYASLDFADGTGELVSEMHAEDGKLTGYIRPIINDVDIFSWEQDVEKQDDGLFQLAWEGLDGLLAAIFTDGETDQVATQIDFEGTLDDPEISTWDTILNIVKNAFFEAYNDRFEGLFKDVTNEDPEVDPDQDSSSDNESSSENED
jgi:hypothetical protein